MQRLKRYLTRAIVGAFLTVCVLLGGGAIYAAVQGIWTQVYVKPISNSRWSMLKESTGTATTTFTPGRTCEVREIRMTGNAAGTFTGTSVSLAITSPTLAWFDPTLTTLDGTSTKTRWITYDPAPTVSAADSVVIGLSASATTVGLEVIFQYVP